MIPALLITFIPTNKEVRVKVYYYITCEALVILLTVVTYSVVVGAIWKLNNRKVCIIPKEGDS